MKIKSEYKLKSVAGEHMVIPTGKASTFFNGIITLNESGKLLFESLQKACDMETLIKLLVDRYNIDHAIAKEDIEAFLNILNEKNVIENDA